MAIEYQLNSEETKNKYALAIHTTTPQLGIAKVCLNNKSDRQSQVWDLGKDLSSKTHQYLLEILHPQTWQDLAFISVAKGPGGFTGTRIGVVLARTIAQQLNIPLYGISTLSAIAYSEIDRHPEKLIAVQMSARREQLFVGIYYKSSENIWSTFLEDKVISDREWLQILNDIGSPYHLIKAPLIIADTAINAIDIAYSQWQQKKYTQWWDITPFYGQDPVS